MSNEDNKKKNTGNRNKNTKNNSGKKNAAKNTSSQVVKESVQKPVKENKEVVKQTPKIVTSPTREEIVIPKKKKKGKTIEIIVMFVLLAVLILLLLSFCHKDSYKVSFMLGEEVYNEEKVSKGEEVEVPKEPTKEGYTFEGWYLDGEKYDFSKEVTSDMKLEAKWKINTYTVTIDDGLGNKKTEEVEYNNKIEEPKVSTREDYDFDGWYVGEEPFDFSKGIKEDVVIEARWIEKEKVSYRVEHYLMGLDGKYSSYDKVELLKANKGSTVTPSTRNYLGFTAPKKTTVKLSDEGDTVVKYYYKRNKYTLTVKGDEGIAAVEGKGTYYYGEKVEVSYEVKEGYKFDKWSSKVSKGKYTMPAKNTTLKANSKPIEYTLIYTDGAQRIEEKHKYTDVFKLRDENAFKDVHSVSYYYGAPKELENTTVLYQSTYDKWIFDENMTYDLGEEVSQLTTKDGDKIVLTLQWKYPTLQEPEREHHDFLGWKDKDGNPIGEITAATPKELELYAQWEVKDHTIVFESNGGSDVDAMVAEAGTTITEPKAPTREGYKFLGWYSDESLNEESKYTFDKMPEKGITLYAKWEIIEYTLTYKNDSYDACEDCKETTYTVESENITLPTPTKANYVFDGWVDEDGNNIGTTLEIQAKDTTLHAQWKYQLVLESNGGTLVSGKEVPEVWFILGKDDNTAPVGNFFSKVINVTWEFDSNEKVTHKFDTPVSCWQFGEDQDSCFTPGQTVPTGFTPTDGKVTLKATYEQTIETPETGTKEGKVLGGWTLNGAEVTFPLEHIKEDITLKAIWSDPVSLDELDETILSEIEGLDTIVSEENKLVVVETDDNNTKVGSVIESVTENIANIVGDKANTITIRIGKVRTVALTDTEWTIESTARNEIEAAIKGALSKLLGVSDLTNKSIKDLDGKQLIIEVELAEAYRTVDGDKTLTYTLQFGKIPVDKTNFDKQAANIMNNNINSQGTKLQKYVLSEDNGVLTFSFYKGTETVLSTCTNAGLKTAMQNLFKIEGIEYITIQFTNPQKDIMKVTARAENVTDDAYTDFAIQFLEPFKQATGISAWSIVNNDLQSFTSNSGALYVYVHAAPNYKFGEGFTNVKTDDEDKTEYLTYEIKFKDINKQAESTSTPEEKQSTPKEQQSIPEVATIPEENKSEVEGN